MKTSFWSIVTILAFVPLSPAFAASRAPLAGAPNSVIGLVYVSHQKEIAIYRQDGGGFVGRITDGISRPEGLAVDASGALYVANRGAADVAIYPRGHRTPSLVLSEGMQYPTTVSVDANETVYVADDDGSVVEYRAGQSHPFLTIPPYVGSSPGVFPTDMTVDASGNIFMAAELGSSFGQDILEYPAGPSPSWQRLNIYTPLRTGISGLAIDRNGRLVIAEFNGASSGPGGILVYDVAKHKFVRTIGHLQVGYFCARFDQGLNRLFAGAAFGRRVFIYDYASGKQIRSIFAGTDNIVGIAAGPS